MSDPSKLKNPNPNEASESPNTNPYLDPDISPSKAVPPEVGAVMVRGTITSVSRDKNGLPRKEGPVYSILWDDGLSEVEIGLQEMQTIVKVDEKELGGHTSLTDDVPIFLEETGKIVGDGIDYIRKLIALEKVRDITKDTECTVEDIFHCALLSCHENVLKAKKVEVRGGEERCEATARAISNILSSRFARNPLALLRFGRSLTRRTTMVQIIKFTASLS